jgi:hypothetical protein
MFLLDKDARYLQQCFTFLLMRYGRTTVMYFLTKIQENIYAYFWAKNRKETLSQAYTLHQKRKRTLQQLLLDQESKGKITAHLSRTKKVWEHYSKLLLGQACKETLRQVPARPRIKETCRIFCWTKTEAKTLIGSCWTKMTRDHSNQFSQDQNGKAALQQVWAGTRRFFRLKNKYF